MELGSLLCEPRQPRCAQCPLRSACWKFEQCRTRAWPPARAKPAVKHLTWVAFCVHSKDGILMVKNNGPWWEAMWDLPRCSNKETLAPLLRKRPHSFRHRGTVAHTVTQHRLQVELWDVLSLDVLDEVLPHIQTHSAQAWVRLRQTAAHPHSQLTKKLLRL